MNKNPILKALALLGLLLSTVPMVTAIAAKPVYQPEPDQAVIYFKREDGDTTAGACISGTATAIPTI